MSITPSLARHLGALRADRGWSLETLATRSGVSRATLSRLENAEVSPTAEVLSKLCAAFGVSMSHVLSMVETGFRAHVPAGSQTSWTDTATGFTRRAISPAAEPLRAEVLECTIPAGRRLHYDRAPVPGLEHHLILLEGALRVIVAEEAHDLLPGDALRYQLHGTTEFITRPDQGARYHLVLA